MTRVVTSTLDLPVADWPKLPPIGGEDAMKLTDLPPHLRPGVARQIHKSTPKVELTDAGRDICAIAIPWPPSVNGLWNTDKRGRRHCTPEYDTYKKTAAVAALACGARPYHGTIDVVLHLHFPKTNRKSDSDSRVKAILDAMNGTLWTDDAQIRDLGIRRFDESEKPHVVILVTPGVTRRLGPGPENVLEGKC
jgi:Holliday junction resolvase RusA-like endonuclease